MRSTPLISVVLPVFNAERYVAAAIESVLTQTLGDFELVIVDDGSRDDSLQIVTSYASADPRIRVVSRPNRGLIATLNEMIALARGTYVARMDADDICRADRLARQAEFLAAHPEVVAVGCRGRFIDPEGAPLADFHDRFSHDEIDGALLRTELGIIHPAAMIRADALRAIGGYRADYRHAEDLDLFLRLAEHGRLQNLPEVLIDYRVHAQSVSHLNQVEQRRSAWRAVDAARVRRGGEAVPEAMKTAPGEETEARLFARWAWWALNGGHLETAGKYATRLLRRRPLAIASWRLIATIARARLRRRLGRRAGGAE